PALARLTFREPILEYFSSPLTLEELYDRVRRVFVKNTGQKGVHYTSFDEGAFKHYLFRALTGINFDCIGRLRR
ncbi:MAG: hypothetical protein K2X97_02705, partial [Mycobacteriaceae bacterium]|nr:hypothetical protein [Mycobacteriaceae bacterium]